MFENKPAIVEALASVIKMTRAGSDVQNIIYEVDDEKEEVVTIQYNNGYERRFFVTADSGAALIRDIMKRIN